MSQTTQGLADLTGDYIIDPAHTRIGFVARHAPVTKVRGAFTQFEGTVHLDEHHPASSSAQVVITAQSLDIGNPERDAYLRGNLLGSEKGR